MYTSKQIKSYSVEKFPANKTKRHQNLNQIRDHVAKEAFTVQPSSDISAKSSDIMQPHCLNNIVVTFFGLLDDLNLNPFLGQTLLQQNVAFNVARRNE